MALRCLVTGAAGFIGSHLSERLLGDGHQVIGVDCFTDYYARGLKEANLAGILAHPMFEFVEDDLGRMDLRGLLDGVQVVFHQAAQAGVRASWGQSFAIYTELNVLNTQRLLEAAVGSPTLKKFVYASSSSVYGNTDTLPLREADRLQPVSPYGVTKLAGEHLARLYAANLSVPTTSLRYFTVYGPRQRPDMAFTKFLRAIYRDQAITVYGDGEQTRDFTFVADAVEANVRAAQHGRPGSYYNIGGGSRVTVNQCLDVLRQVTGLPVRVNHIETQHGDVRHTWADTSLAQEELGFRPSVSIQEGLAQQAAWIRATIDAERTTEP
ncbi:MAG: NAD-dependent epimerase/dehydratase family protein [Anaerolineae bacterium]|jgi:nucleoside-diphosphate-sugar epimerase